MSRCLSSTVPAQSLSIDGYQDGSTLTLAISSPSSLSNPSLTLVCRCLASRPPPTLVWLRDGAVTLPLDAVTHQTVTVSAGNSLLWDVTSVLNVTSVVTSDDGVTYSCHAVNYTLSSLQDMRVRLNVVCENIHSIISALF